MKKAQRVAILTETAASASPAVGCDDWRSRSESSRAQSAGDENELFTQSVAEEIMYQREAALRLVESQGGLALDVTAAALVPRLLETYLRVKERGLL
jgi:hypothetical protein